MVKPLNLTGERFGRLLVQERGEGSKGHTRFWCQCDCGQRKLIASTALMQGVTVSCGCVMRSVAKTHGKYATKEYTTWKGMWQRCTNPNRNSYRLYGARGIGVCERWESFEMFLEDIGPAPTMRHTLDRVNPNGNYCPENCRWATSLQQGNNRRNNRRVSLNGQENTVSEWARILGMNKATLTNRLNKGWSEEQALTTPPWGLRA